MLVETLTMWQGLLRAFFSWIRRLSGKQDPVAVQTRADFESLMSQSISLARTLEGRLQQAYRRIDLLEQRSDVEDQRYEELRKKNDDIRVKLDVCENDRTLQLAKIHELEARIQELSNKISGTP